MSESTLPGRPVGTDAAVANGQTWAQRLGALLSARSLVPFWLGAILLLGAAFRFTGLNWDQGIHHHPDERFLTSVVNDIQWPSGSFWSSYFDEATSTLNPRNVGQTFFVYGDFPIIFVKGVTVALDNVLPREDGQSWQGYGHNYKVGRVVNGVMDLGTLLVLFALARRLYGDHRLALLAALLYSLTVLPIQHAHFWVVDNFATFFSTLTLYWLVRIFRSEGPGSALLYTAAGLSFGMALASKVSVYTLVLVFGAVVLAKLVQGWRESGEISQTLLEALILRLGVAGLFTLVAFRIFQPYAFEGLLTPAARWMSNLSEVRGQITGEADPPWGFQWANRTPILFPLQNMVLWGMGLPLGVAAWVGWGAAAWQLLRRARWLHLIPVISILILFLNQGTQWVKSLRYSLPIYPTLVLLAAWLLVALWEHARRSGPLLRTGGVLAWTPRRAALLTAGVVGGTLLYAMAFTSLYTRPHTHIQAAQWIYENVPDGAVVAQEHYDEGVPFGMPDMNPEGKSFYGLTEVTDPATGATHRNGQLKWYFEDNPAKLEEALGWLDEADYIVTVSNRLYGSTARLPARYPMTVNYYQALFSGELGFRRVADISSGPQLFGIELDSQQAEEAFSVYDHPRVQIFQKTDAYDSEGARALLSEGVDWNNISRLTAKQWTESGGRSLSLLLPPGEQALYERSGTWARLFDRASLQNRLPVLVWALLLEGLGLLALPYLFLVGRGLPERGYTFAKALGLLLVGWLVWMLASLRLVTFSAGAIALAISILSLGGLLLFIREALRRQEQPLPLLRRWAARHGRLFLLSETVFWLAFGLVLAIRWANPDIWHPDLGGERPMDFAYLNATIKSAHFPPMDPWFAGGYINYYYFGFVLLATLVRFTGVVPAIAYNLIIPTLFALLAAGVWGAALALLTPTAVRRRAVEPAPAPSSPAAARSPFLYASLATLFVCVLGNLGEVKVLANGLRQMSTLTFRSGIPGLETLVLSVDGLLRGMILQGQSLPGRMEWPYWNATRTIPETINEFPWFTFLYADLHAHMMALPFTALAIGLTLAVLRAPLRDGRLAGALRLTLLALVIGALWPINTWDFPTYALVAFAGLGLREWRRDGAITLRGLLAVAWRWALVLGLGRLLFYPFHANYGSAYSSVERWQGTRTGLGDFLIVHGFFLFLIAFALLSDWRYGQGHNGAVRLIRFQVRTLFRRARAVSLYNRMVRPALATQIALLASLVAATASVGLFLVGWAVPAVVLLLLVAALLLFFRARPEPLWQMALFFMLLGLGLTLAVELVVLKGDIGRMNTVFKFYLQVWVLWGIAAAVGAARVARHLPRWLPEWRAVWRFGFALLFGVALLYPIFATHAKINDRFDRSVGATLDGSAFLEKAILQERAGPIELKWDADAIRWVQENLPGSPTVVEMQTWDKLYGWGSRFAMWTGNPTIVGWHWHQQQQRASVQPDPVMPRVQDVQQNIYNTPDAQLAHDTLLRYGADYLVVGALERAYSVPEGIAKFEPYRGTFWDLVYENPDVKIYRVIGAGGQ